MSRSRSRGRSGTGRIGVLAALAVVGAVALGVLWAQPNGQAERKAAAKKAGRAQAQQQGKTQTPPAGTAPAAVTAPAAAQPVTRMIGNQQVAVDPATGRLRPPTPEETKALAEQLQHYLTHDADGLQVVQLPDGTYMVDLQDTFQDAVMATKDTKGKVSLHCVNSYEQAKKLLSGAATTIPDGSLSPAVGAGANKRARRPSKSNLEVK